MGQRLNIEIRYGSNPEDVLENCYYHLDGYTSTSAVHALGIIEKYESIKDSCEKDCPEFAIKLLVRNMEGFEDGEIKRYTKTTLPKAVNRNTGIASIFEEGIKETRISAEATLVVDIKNEVINFEDCMFFESFDDIKEWREQKPGYTVTLLKTKWEPSEIPFKDFKSFVNQWASAQNGYRPVCDGKPSYAWTFIE